MPRQLERLTTLGLSKIRVPGMYPDGGGLYLQVGPSGTRSWILRYALNGRERQMGLGPLHDVSLAEAREKVAECRKLRRDGIDPIDARKNHRARTQLEAVKFFTFKDAADIYIRVNCVGWWNAKYVC